MADIRRRIRFATIDRSAKTIGKSCATTTHATRVARTGRHSVGHGRTHVVAKSAMHDVVGQVDFATIGNDAIAIGITRVTSANDTRGASAFRVAIRQIATNFATHAAIKCVRGQIRFATAPDAIVAIVEPRRARPDGADAIVATGGRIRRSWTRGPARPAIEWIGSRIDFAAVDGESIAIRISGYASPENACARFARGLRIGGRRAQIPASTAMICIVADRDFATIGKEAIAVGKALFAKTNRTHRIRAATKRIRCFTLGAASSAVRRAFGEVYLATVQERVVAIGKPRCADDSAACFNAGRAAIDSEWTRFVATAAIVDVAFDVGTSIEATRFSRGTKDGSTSHGGLGICAAVCGISAAFGPETICSVIARCGTADEHGRTRYGDKESKMVFHREPRRRRALTASPRARAASAPIGVSFSLSDTIEQAHPPPPVVCPHLPEFVLAPEPLVVLDSEDPPPPLVPPLPPPLLLDDAPPAPLVDDPVGAPPSETMHEPFMHTSPCGQMI